MHKDKRPRDHKSTPPDKEEKEATINDLLEEVRTTNELLIELINLLEGLYLS